MPKSILPSATSDLGRERPNPFHCLRAQNHFSDAGKKELDFVSANKIRRVAQICLGKKK